MTAVLRRTGAIQVFHLDGKLPDPTTPKFLECVQDHRFRVIENAASEEVSVGWVSHVNPSGDDLELDDFVAGRLTWLRMRIDTKRLPKDWVQMHLASEVKARGRKLSVRERREFKQDIADKLLPRVLPSIQLFDVLLVPDKNLAFLLSSGTAVCDAFTQLVWNSLGVTCNRVLPGVLAQLVGYDEKRVADAQPVRWPDVSGRTETEEESVKPSSPVAPDEEALAKPAARQKSLGFDVTCGFLGEEFLLWLWYQWDTRGGEYHLSQGRHVGVAIDDLLVFAPLCGDESVPTVRGGMPTRTPVAAAAKRSGLRLSRARLIIADGCRQWVATLDGATLTFSGVRLPEDAEDVESPDDRTADRAANWWALQDIVAAVFGEFLKVRLSKSWLKAEGEAMATWMAE